MDFLPNKEKKTKGLLLMVILITVGIFIVIGIASQYILSDFKGMYSDLKSGFPIEKLQSVILTARILILLGFIGIFYSLKEGIVLMWVGYLLVVASRVAIAFGIDDEIGNIKYFIPLIYFVIPITITIILRPIVSNFKQLIPNITR